MPKSIAAYLRGSAGRDAAAASLARTSVFRCLS
jgi:hypothetical protein